MRGARRCGTLEVKETLMRRVVLLGGAATVVAVTLAACLSFTLTASGAWPRGYGEYVGFLGKKSTIRTTLTLSYNGKQAALMWRCPPLPYGSATVKIDSRGRFNESGGLWLAEPGVPHVGPRWNVAGHFLSRTKVVVSVHDMHGCRGLKASTTLTLKGA